SFVPCNKDAQSGSTGFPVNADLAAQLKRLAAALPAAVSFAASHLLDSSGRLAATWVMQESTWSSQAVAELPQSPAFAKAAVYCDSTLATHSLRPEESPVFVALARHANLPLSLFPIAFSFPATHRSQSAMARRQTDWGDWVNHRLPSGPFVMSLPGMENSVIALGLSGEIRPIAPLRAVSVNQRLPSGPVTMANGRLFAVGMGNSVMVFGAPGLMRPMFPPVTSVNHRFPSGPVVMPPGVPCTVGIGNSLMVFGLSGVIRPIWSPPSLPETNDSANQMLPSGPIVMPRAPCPLGMANSVIVLGLPGVMRPIFPVPSVNHRLP